MKNVRLSAVKKHCPPGFTEVKLTPGARQIRITLAEGLMGEYLESLVKYGGMFTVGQAAKLAGLSKQRISELVKKGQLPLVEVVFALTPDADLLVEELIPGNAIRRWVGQAKSKGGRGHRAAAISLAECAA